jgi:glycosyltransferase involved in cell wall biosynthesis
MEKVSVIIIARNEEKNIGRCIKSVLNQNYKNLEIIVVNDASTDKTNDIAKKMGAKVITNKKNLGIARSFNRGIKFSRGNIVVTLHADAELIGKSWIKYMVNTLLKNKDVAAVTSLRFPRVEDKPSPIERVNLYFGGAYIVSEPKKMTEIDWLPTRSDAFKKTALKQVNYFNEKLKVSGDCIDISTKLRNKGYKLMIDPKVKTRVYLSTQQNNFFRVLKKRIDFGKVIPYLLTCHSFSLIRNKTWVITTIPYIIYFLFFILLFFNPIFLFLFLLENLFLSIRIAKVAGFFSFPAAFVLLPIYTILWNLGIIYGIFLIKRKVI